MKEPHGGDTELPANQAKGELSRFSLREKIKDRLTLYPNFVGQFILLTQVSSEPPDFFVLG